MCKDNPISCGCGCSTKKVLLRPRKLSYGGGLPNDQLRQQGQQQQTAAAVGQAVPDIMKLLGGLGVGGGGAAGAAGAVGAGAGAASGLAAAAGPVGLALAAGSMIGGVVDKATTDKDGFAETSTGAQLGRGIGSIVNPVGQFTKAFSGLGRADLTAGEKVASFIPGIGALATDRADQEKKKLMLRQRASTAINQSESGVYAAEGIRLRPRRLELGGELTDPMTTRRPGMRPRPASTAMLTPQQQDAKKYYDNIMPTLNGLIENKYDEKYTPAGTNQMCTKNSCVSFANTAQERAMGTEPMVRDKQHLYNPEFARTHDELGWQKIPLSDLQPGDRVQRWKSADTSTNGLVRQADTGGKDYFAGGQPTHMMIFGGYQNQGEKGVGANANFYEDGMENEPARRNTRPLESNAVAYRYIGVNGQPTNDPAKAVATNSNAAAGVAKRSEGGTLSLRPRRLREGGSIIASGALHSEKHGLQGQHVGKTGIPVLYTSDGQRAAEIERNELVLGDRATERLENLMQRHAGGDKLAANMAGKMLAAELRNNTRPNERFEKRLGVQEHVQTAQSGDVAMMGRDGLPHFFSGNNRVMSQRHTRELVNKALGAKHGGHHRALGLRAFTMLKQQDKRPIEHAKS